MQSACVILRCHLWPARLYKIFRHYLINSTVFKNLVIEHKMCALIFSITFSEIFLILRINERDIIINVHTGFHVKYPLFLQDYIETWIISTDFRKTLKYQIQWNSVLSEPSCSTWTDGQTDRQRDRQTDRRDVANSRFSYFLKHT
jgi:hypothetical protein